jgi:hypothetical protein
VENEGIVIDQVAKVNILLQSYVSRAEVDGFALVADMNHVVQAKAECIAPVDEWAHALARCARCCPPLV